MYTHIQSHTHAHVHRGGGTLQMSAKKSVSGQSKHQKIVTRKHLAVFVFFWGGGVWGHDS